MTIYDKTFTGRDGRRFRLRPIQAHDDPEIGQLIRGVLKEYQAAEEGTAFADDALDQMFDTYARDERSGYWIVRTGDTLAGGAGIAPLKGTVEPTCELQKMYLRPEFRGSGLGSELLRACEAFARQKGFRYCYLETLPQLQHAMALYERKGFVYLDQPLVDTGHFSCTVWMQKQL